MRQDGSQPTLPQNCADCSSVTWTTTPPSGALTVRVCRMICGNCSTNDLSGLSASSHRVMKSCAGIGVPGSQSVEPPQPHPPDHQLPSKRWKYATAGCCA